MGVVGESTDTTALLTTGQRPKNWREKILYLYGNGTLPLTGLTSRMGSEATNDPEFNWWDQTIEATTFSFTAGEVYTEATLTTAYATTGGGAQGATLYIKTTAANASLVVAGMVILIRDASDYTVDVLARVSAVTVNGASSYLTVVLLEADDNGTVPSSANISDCDTILVVGSAFEEGAAMGDARAFKPTKHYNYTQIFRTSLSLSRTAMQTKVRTNPQTYQKMKREALEMHGIDMELAFWFGKPYETTLNSKPIRYTGGVLNWIRSNTYAAANNISNYATDDSIDSGAYNGKTWIAAGGGYDWFNSMLERTFRYGGKERWAVCGNGAILGIQRLAAATGSIQLQPVATRFGMNIMTWVTPFGTVHLTTHPLWNQQAMMRNMMILLEPQNIMYRYIQDTKFFPDNDGNNKGNRIDGKNEEWLSECGLEFHHPETCSILYGVGLDNA
jgi:hypothetical protein